MVEDSEDNTRNKIDNDANGSNDNDTPTAAKTMTRRDEVWVSKFQRHDVRIGRQSRTST